MAFFYKNINTIIDDSMKYLNTTLGINTATPGAKFKALIDILAKEVSLAYDVFNLNTMINMIHGAQGIYLDWLGDIFGIQRLTGTKAITNSAENTIKFYTDATTFGAISNGQGFTIPTNTKIWGFKDGEQVDYYTTADVVCGAGAKVAYASAKAFVFGSFSDMPGGTLTNYTASGLTSVDTNHLFVTNEQSIENGSDYEDDERYRYRIIFANTGNKKANVTALRLAALAFPGISDVVITPQILGIGTTEVMVKTVTSIASATTLMQLGFYLNDIISSGEKVIIREPDYVEVAFKLTFTVARSSNTNTINTLKQKITSYLIDYINNLEIGSTVSINKMAVEIMKLDSNILSVGSANKFFDNIYLIFNVMDKYIRKEIDGDYTFGSREKPIIATTDSLSYLNISSPINITETYA